MLKSFVAWVLLISWGKAQEKPVKTLPIAHNLCAIMGHRFRGLWTTSQLSIASCTATHPHLIPRLFVHFTPVIPAVIHVVHTPNNNYN